MTPLPQPPIHRLASSSQVSPAPPWATHVFSLWPHHLTPLSVPLPWSSCLRGWAFSPPFLTQWVHWDGQESRLSYLGLDDGPAEGIQRWGSARVEQGPSESSQLGGTGLSLSDHPRGRASEGMEWWGGKSMDLCSSLKRMRKREGSSRCVPKWTK